MEKFIEITQDSAGVIERSNSKAQGFFTGGIQSCLVSVYECEDAFVMVHDSGQIKISDICKLIKKYGEVKKVTATFGPQLNSQHHQTRFNKILKNIGYGDKNVDVLEYRSDTFLFNFPLQGRASATENITPAFVDKIPDRDVRMSIIELNNFFLKPNSQKLGLDIQYIDSSYQKPRGLDHSLNEMIKIIKKQPNFYFPNLAFLEKAHGMKIVNMPQHLLKVAEKYQVSQFMVRTLTAEESMLQAIEFEKFRKSA
ncbi:MAG: hypothetical protein HWE24_15540 [Oceanospirillaceae bacterium]|nr:hypothetical protein [Oceanospirillaceae bacterium]